MGRKLCKAINLHKGRKKVKHNFPGKNCIEGSKENIDLLSAFTRYCAGGTGLHNNEERFLFFFYKVASMALCVLVRSYLCVSLCFPHKLYFFLLFCWTFSSMFMTLSH